MASRQVQVVHWGVTQATYFQYFEFLEMLKELDADSDEFQAVVEEIRSLPHFPYGYDTLNAHIIPVVTDVQFN